MDKMVTHLESAGNDEVSAATHIALFYACMSIRGLLNEKHQVDRSISPVEFFKTHTDYRLSIRDLVPNGLDYQRLYEVYLVENGWQRIPFSRIEKEEPYNIENCWENVDILNQFIEQQKFFRLENVNSPVRFPYL